MAVGFGDPQLALIGGDSKIATYQKRLSLLIRLPRYKHSK